MKAKELSRAKPTMCSSDDCDLVACVGWASNKEPGELWFGCLDCQAEFYDGFPEGGELPITYMSEETKKLILEKCTVDPEVSLEFSFLLCDLYSLEPCLISVLVFLHRLECSTSRSSHRAVIARYSRRRQLHGHNHTTTCV